MSRRAYAVNMEFRDTLQFSGSLKDPWSLKSEHNISVVSCHNNSTFLRLFNFNRMFLFTFLFIGTKAHVLQNPLLSMSTTKEVMLQSIGKPKKNLFAPFPHFSLILPM